MTHLSLGVYLASDLDHGRSVTCFVKCVKFSVRSMRFLCVKSVILSRFFFRKCETLCEDRDANSLSSLNLIAMASIQLWALYQDLVIESAILYALVPLYIAKWTDITNLSSYLWHGIINLRYSKKLQHAE